MSKSNSKVKGKSVDATAASKAYEAIVASKEQLLTAWIAATGLRPEETMIVVRNYAGVNAEIFCRKLTDEDLHVLCPKCGCNLTKS